MGWRKSQFNEDFKKSYNEDSDIEYFIEADVQYHKKLHELCNKLTFLPEKVKIGETEKTVARFNDTKEYVIHLRNLKQALNHGLTFKKVQSLLDSIKKLGLKSWYVHRTKKKRKIKKMYLGKIFSSWWIM